MRKISEPTGVADAQDERLHSDHIKGLPCGILRSVPAAY